MANPKGLFWLWNYDQKQLEMVSIGKKAYRKLLMNIYTAPMRVCVLSQYHTATV